LPLCPRSSLISGPSLVALWEMESIGLPILCSLMDEATTCAVNGARLPRFTVPFTSSFTRTSERTFSPRTRCIQTGASIRTRHGSELGWSDPVFTATGCVAVAPAQHRRLRDDAMPRSEGQWERKTTRLQMVLGEEGNSYALQLRLLRLLHPAHSPSEFGKGSWPKVPTKSSKLRTTEMGGSDPGNFGPSRPKLCSGSLPPNCSQFADSEKRAATESTKFACAL